MKPLVQMQTDKLPEYESTYKIAAFEFVAIGNKWIRLFRVYLWRKQEQQQHTPSVDREREKKREKEKVCEREAQS